MSQQSSPSSPFGSAMGEWSAARETIERFDGYLNDLRKYGFSLVTGLLAVTGFLSSSPSAALTPIVKLGVTTSILALIVTLSIMDSQYRSIRMGAITRAELLENYLNMGLSTFISDYVDTGRFGNHYYDLIYPGFAVSAWILGVSVLWRTFELELLISALALFGIFLIRKFGGDYTLNTVDFRVDQKQVTKGSPFVITFTSLIKPDRKDPNKQRNICIGYSVFDLANKQVYKKEPECFDFAYFGYRNWLLPTDGIEPGLYDISSEWTGDFAGSTRLIVQIMSLVLKS